MRQMLEAAAEYIRLGYGVVPLSELSKIPHRTLAPHGLHSAITDYNGWERLYEAAEQGERFGVGILPPRGVIVLDVDEPRGVKLVERLASSLPLGECPLQLTPSGGMHYIMAVKDSQDSITATTRRHGVDIRGNGRAYIVASPTVIAREDGSRGGYRWVRPLLPPSHLPAVPWQGEGGLSEVFERKPLTVRALRIDNYSCQSRGDIQQLLNRIAYARKGERHNTLLRCALAAVLGGARDERSIDMIFRAGVSSGLSEFEVRRVLEWVLSRV
jgi:hypothetical protein